MCGIAGIVDWSGQDHTAVVRAMCDRIRHRGPDDADVQHLGPATFGHRRLAIIDLSTNGRQPMATSDGRYHITYNGEVYNFEAIREELRTEGCRFRSETDTEVVLYAYQQWGPACVARFNGMFAFAVWDSQKQELFLARDRFGQKPLCYHQDAAGTVYFASELSALEQVPSIPRVCSLESLNCFLSLGYILNPLTLYDDVYKLQPGHWMIVSTGDRQLRTTRYWDFIRFFHDKTCEHEQDIAHHVRELLRDSVRRRLISDVPLGAFLSGGVDSSSVVAMMCESSPADVLTFSMGFADDAYNELDDARRVSEWLGTSHHDYLCEPAQQAIDEYVQCFDEPFADNSLIPTLEVAGFAARSVKVVLTGDGADELFAGYDTYKADRYYHVARHLPRFLKTRLSEYFRNRALLDRGKLGPRFRIGQFLHGCCHTPDRAHYAWRQVFTPLERVAILGESHRDLVFDTDPFVRFERYYREAEGLHWLDRHLYVDCMTWLTDDILVKVDRSSMFHSLEARNPYLDFELAQYAASIPVEYKMRGTKTKYILKKALADVLPRFVLEKRKSGFNAPIKRWLPSTELNEYQMFMRHVFDCKVTKPALDSPA